MGRWMRARLWAVGLGLGLAVGSLGGGCQPGGDGGQRRGPFGDDSEAAQRQPRQQQHWPARQGRSGAGEPERGRGGGVHGAGEQVGVGGASDGSAAGRAQTG